MDGDRSLSDFIATAFPRSPLSVSAILAALSTLLLLGCSAGPSPFVQSAEESYAAGDLPAAITFYEQVLVETPEDLASRTRLALLLIEDGESQAEQGNWRVADARYGRARELGGAPVESEEMLLRHSHIRELAGMGWEAQREPLERAAKLGASAPTLRALAYGWDRRGDVHRALTAYELVLALDTQDAGLLQRVAQLRAETGDVPGATSAYEALLKLDPESTSAQLGLASLREQAGDTAGAEALYRALTQSRPDNAGAWRQLLGHYKRTGNTDGADEVRTEMERRWPKAKKRKRPLR